MPSCFFACRSVRASRKIQLASWASEVGAGVRLAVALAPDVFARQDLRQEAALLSIGAVADQQRADHDDAVVGQACAAVALELLNVDELLGR
jgi:hypothetical protein